MHRFVAITCFLGLFAASAMAAQPADFPRAEIFGGYQYTHLEGGPNGNGWNFALNGNYNEFFGITADFAAAYASESGVNLSNYTYTFGPVLALRANEKYTPFVHLLIGGDHATASVPGASISGNGYALMAGGGVDFNLSRQLAFRAAQADWMLVHGHGSTSSRNLRISTGIVFKF